MKKVRLGQLKILLGVAALFAAVAGCQDSALPTEPEPTGRDSTVSGDYNPRIPDDYSSISHISNFDRWGSYNVHDPTIIKAGDTYYMYSTDVLYGGGGVPASDSRRQPRIPIRKSKDLIHWDPIGYVFNSMPDVVIEFMRERQPSYSPVSVWAPYIIEVEGEYRLYYSVPANDMHMAYLGLATSDDPEGPWENQGRVLATYPESSYNGIDPAISVDRKSGRHWMIYGSWEDGIHAVELDPETGFRKDENDSGDIIVSRPLSYGAAPLEGAEVQYNPSLDKYFLFVSYDTLIEHYNVRVGRADQPQGPYYDINGRRMSDLADNFPKITAQYQFDNHSGWQGVGHTGILKDGDQYYVASQGRLGSNIHLMNLHLRKVFWTDDGWPVLSPERYAGVPQLAETAEDVAGAWEVIRLEQTESRNQSETVTLTPGGGISEYDGGSWQLDGETLSVEMGEHQFEAHLFRGWDWENSRVAMLFTGLDGSGIGVWGKKRRN